MWMELGLFGIVGLVPVIAIVVVLEVAAQRRARNLRSSSLANDWKSSSELQKPN
jgi:uncharacterized membrane protein (GlpM family)